MTREQAINYLISRGLTQDQVGDVVRALTYIPRDCANCKHYVVKDTRTNWESQETTKIYGCECWECEYEPTTKNDLGVDCINRATVLHLINDVKNSDGFKDYSQYEYLFDQVDMMPSVTPQLSVPEVTALAEWTEKLTKASEDAYNKGYADGMKAQEPRKGRWILTDVEGNRIWHCNCSECGKDPQDYIGGSEDWWLIKNNLPKFCPNCGSDNREVEE